MFFISGSVGRNVLYVDPHVNNKGVEYNLEYNSTSGNSQNDYVYLSLGIVTNTG